MRLKIHSALLLALVWALAPRAVQAACPAIPYVFTDNLSVVAALSTNTNNTTLRACATSIDNSQIGSNGIYASQIIPISVATATFGGVLPYVFPYGLSGPTISYSTAINATGETHINTGGASVLQTLTGATYLTAAGVSGNVYFGDTGSPGRYGFFNPTTGLTAYTQVITPVVQAQTTALFGTSTTATTIGMGAVGFSATYPTIANSADGGINFQDVSTSTNAFRFLTWNGTSTTTPFYVTNAGNAAVTGTFSAGLVPGGMSAGDLSASRSTTTGAAFFGSNGSQNLNFGITVAGGWTAGGGSFNVVSLAKAGVGSYPYDSTGINANEHIERWVGTAPVAGQIHTFTTAYSSSTSYECSISDYATFTPIGLGSLAAGSVGVYASSGTQQYQAVCVGT